MSDFLATCHCNRLYGNHTWPELVGCAENDPGLKPAHELEIGDVITHPMFGDGDEWVIVVKDRAVDNDGLMTITPHKGRAFQYASDNTVQLYTEREAAIYGELDALLEEERDRIKAKREASNA